jgi:PAS domain S-box-containing protein
MSTYNLSRQRDIVALQSIVELKQLPFDTFPEIRTALKDSTQFCKGKGAVLALFTKEKFWVKSVYNFEESKFGICFSNLINSASFNSDEKIVEYFKMNDDEGFLAVPIIDDKNNKVGVLCINQPKATRVTPLVKQFLNVISTSIESVFQKELLLLKFNSERNIVEQSKKSLLQKENLIKYTYDFAPIGMLKTTLSGEIILANNKFKSMMSLGNEELIGKSWFLNVIEKEKIIEQWHSCTSAKRFFTSTCSFVQPNNTKAIVEIQASPVVTVDGEIRYLLFVTDVTSKVREEERYRREEEIKQLALEKKEAFLANMSHEIRSPMNAILGFADILNETLVNKQQKEYINVIQSAGQNLLSVINNILDYSKSENGKVKIANHIISWDDVERNVYKLLKKKADSKKIKFNYKKSNNIPGNLLGDIVLINQVLVNLVDNAIKFTDKGRVDLAINFKSETDATCKLEFVVKDSGIGISEEAQHLVFDRYYQVKDDLQKCKSGTGLGLNISKNLIAEMGGDISVKSNLGKGSEFSFVLEFVKDVVVTKRTEKVIDLISKNTGKLKILLFEDNELNKQLMQHIIKGFGFDLDVAENGRVGVDLLKQKAYDVVVMDLDMPIMDGYAATKTIRNELNLDIPILAMTGHRIVGEKERCLAIGMNDFILKPINKSELFEKLANLTFSQFTEDLKSVLEPSKQPTSSKKGSYLKNLSNGDPVFEREMIKVFINTIPDKMFKLNEAVIARDSSVIHKLTDNIRGSIAIMSIPFASEMLSELDELSLDNSSFTQLDLKFKEVDNIVNSYCELYIDEFFDKKELKIA